MGRSKKRRAAQQHPTKSQPISYPYLFGGDYGYGGRNNDFIRSDAGAALAYQMVGTVNRCIEIITNAVNNIPWELVTGEGDSEKVIASNADRYPKHAFANAMRGVYMEQSIPLRKLMGYSELLYGETYIEKLPIELLKPRGIKWLNPLWIFPQISRGLIDWFQYSNPWGDTAILYPCDVAYEHTFNPQNDLRGYSVVNAVLDEINIDRDLKRFLKAFFRNNARPGMVVSPKGDQRYNQQDIGIIKEQIQNYLKGVDNGNSTLVSPISAVYEAFESPDVDKQYKISEAIRTEIYMGFGVPPSMAGDSGGATYKDGEEVLEAFYFNTINPMAERQAAFINTFLMPFFDPSGLTAFRVITPQPRNVILNKTAEVTLIDMQVKGGYLSLADGARAMKLTPDPRIENLYMIGGIPVPIDMLQAYYERMNAQPAAPTYGTPQISTPPTPQLNSGQASIIGGQITPPHDHRTHEEHTYGNPAYVFEKGLSVDEWRRLALDELRAWVKRDKADKSFGFVPIYTVDTLRSFGGNYWDPLSQRTSQAWFDYAFAAVRYEPFKATLARVERAFNKSFDDTRQEFEDEFLIAIGDASSGSLSKDQLKAALESVIRNLGERAYLDGLLDGGIEDPELDSEDITTIDNLRSDAESYLADFIATFDTKTQTQLDQTPQMWSNKTLQQFYDRGLAAADANGSYIWRLGKTEVHCATCLGLNGTKMRMKNWLKNGILPKSDKLDCKGFNCDCYLDPVRGR